MNDILIVTILAFLFLSYKFIIVFKTKEVSKNNKIIAWSIYGFCIVGLISVNMLF